MASNIHLRIDWIPPTTLGVNKHTHWRYKSPDEKASHMIGKSAIFGTTYTKDNVPAIPVLVVVFHWDKASRKKDSDNALGTAKHLVDGICKGLGIDDKRFITSMAFQQVDPKRRGFTEIIIREATPEERRLGT